MTQILVCFKVSKMTWTLLIKVRTLSSDSLNLKARFSFKICDSNAV